VSKVGQYYTLTPPIATITGNVGGAIGPDFLGNINLVGVNPITVSGNPFTHTLEITVETATTAQIGVTTLATDAETIAGVVTTDAVTPSSLAAKLGVQTDNGVAYGHGTTNAIQWTAAGTDGQIIIAATGLAPIFGDITSLAGTIDITTAPHVVNLEVGDTVAINYLTDDTNVAIPAVNVLTVAGGANIYTSSAASTVTIAVDGTTDHTVQIGNATGSLTSLAAMTDGQLVIGSTGNDPAVATLTSTGGSINITNGAGTINLETAGGVIWTREAGAAVGIADGHGYIPTNALLTAFTLPAVSAVGDECAIIGESAAGWTIAQNAGQNIQFSNLSTTVGVGGLLASSNRYDTVHIVCRVANTTWHVVNSTGNLTVV
jgi:hypothetical protein